MPYLEGAGREPGDRVADSLPAIATRPWRGLRPSRVEPFSNIARREWDRPVQGSAQTVAERRGLAAPGRRAVTTATPAAIRMMTPARASRLDIRERGDFFT